MRLKNEHVRSEPYRIEETKPEKKGLKGGFQDGEEKQRRQNDFS
jgi:hypothetical protein